MTSDVTAGSPDDPDELDEDLRRYRDEVQDPAAGFFGPDSLFWKVGRENVLALPGPAAILLQLAHPLVAAGVDEHSDFREDPAGRLHSTFRYVHRITFGDADQAVETAQIVRRMHDRVRGTLRESVGDFPAGSEYHANRPDLLLWVHATLVDQALLGYEKLVGPLTRSEKEAYYRESKTFARLFGVPDGELPENLREFYEYFEATVDGTLAVGPRGKRLQRQLFHANRFAMPVQYFLAGGFLPDRVRRLFELPWSSTMQGVFNGVCGGVRRLLPAVPGILRYVRKYRHRRRVLEGRGEG